MMIKPWKIFEYQHLIVVLDRLHGTLQGIMRADS